MVSVIITTFGGSPKLERAIKSVMNQTYQDIEVIVVDDNNPGTEARTVTEEIINKFACYENVFYFKHPRNLNGAVARNTGIKSARGEYICFLDDDDIYLKNRIQKAVAFLHNNSECIGVCYGVACITGTAISKVISYDDAQRLSVEDMFVNQNAIGSGSNIFLRREAVQSVNGFDEDFLRFQDVEFMIRALKKGNVQYQADIEIVKDVSDARIPRYKNVKNAMILFNHKFGDELKSQGQDIIDKYLQERYEYLLLLALLEANKGAIQEVEDLLIEAGLRGKNDFKPVSIEVVIASFKRWGKNIIPTPIYRKLKTRKSATEDNTAKEILGLDKYNEIHGYL